MTFNEGIRIDTSTTSSGGGMGGRGLAVGGGVGGLVVVLIALFFGIDPGSVTGGQSPQQPGAATPGFDVSQCKTGKDANDNVNCRVIATGNSVDQVWSQLLKGYSRPKLHLFTESTNTACGAATSDVGPFYCPADRTVYIDTSFYQVLQDRFGSSGGPLAQEYVIAHEYGHHVQNLLGIDDEVRKAQDGASQAEANALSVKMELQADCFAGVWAKSAYNRMEQGDLDEAIDAAQAVGDDAIQGSNANQESFTHGTSEQRKQWFTTGFESGDASRCDTFS